MPDHDHKTQEIDKTEDSAAVADVTTRQQEQNGRCGDGSTPGATAGAASEGEQKDAPRGASAPDHPPTHVSTWLVRAIGVLVPALLLFPKLGAGGIWDPYELNVADFARRVAVHVWGAEALKLAGADNSLPTIESLGKGELPFTSIGLGFAAFGLHEWAGRLPLAIWALAGALATYWMLARLMDEKAGAYGAIALSAMPTFFVQARTMLGDIVTIAAVAIALAGLAVATFDVSATPRSRVGAAAIAAVGLVAGFMARGILIGVAVPLLTVGLASLLMTVSVRTPRRDSLRNTLGGIALACGMGAALVGGYVLAVAQGAQAVRILGTVLNRPAQVPSFDDTLAALGHGLLPWSAFLPFAVGRLFRPAVALSEEQAAREMGLRAVLLVGMGVCFGAFALMVVHAGHIPFAGLALLAGIAAVAVRDLERGAAASRTLAIGVVTFLALFYRDYKMWPEKGLAAFGVSSVGFPDTFKQDATQLIIGSAAVCGILLFASWLERDLPSNTIFDWKEYRDVWRALRTIADGNVVFVGIVVEAALLGVALLFSLGLKLKWNAIATMSANVRFMALNAWWAIVVLIGAVVVLAFLFRDYFRWVFKRYGASRPFAWSEMVLVGRSLRQVVKGPNLKAFLVLEGVLVVVAAVPALGSLAGWAAIAGLSDKVRLLLMLLWVLIPVAL
ncbi:MAG: glycosyltransferase family 39 protein, partial [Polyangiaceae bacterium]|nr:glycosyltransferase family 39 protein [Polyangiaceae bacterium]